MQRLTEKIDAGAKHIQVQAIFGLGPMRFWIAKVVRRGLYRRVRFLAAIFSFSGAERLHVLREILGLSILDYLLARVGSRNSERRSLTIMLKLIYGIREIEGASSLLIRSMGAEDWAPRIIEAAGLGGELVY